MFYKLNKDKRNFLQKNSALFILLTMLSGCASEGVNKLEGNTLAPAASGSVEYQKGLNNNTKIKLETSCLSVPSRLVSGATTYILWASPVAADAIPQNMGALQVDKDLKGEIETMIPFQEFDLFVTAELANGVTAPSGEHILQTRITRKQ